MSMVFADFMNPMDRELESFKLSLESHMRQIDLMKESTNGMLEIAYLEAEQAVLENGGDYDMLSDFYMEAEQKATEQKTGIIRSIINWISRQFSKLSDWLSNVFGSKTKQRLDPNKNYTVNKTAFNFFKSLPTKIIDGIESAVNAITSNKAVDLGAMITSIVAMATNDKLKKHLTSFMDAVKGKKTNKTPDGDSDPVDNGDKETVTKTGAETDEAVKNGKNFLDRLKAVIAKIDKYLSEKRATAVEKRVEAKNKKNETPTNNTGTEGTNQTTQTTTNAEESAEDNLSLYDAIQYFQEKTGDDTGNKQPEQSTRTSEDPTPTNSDNGGGSGTPETSQQADSGDKTEQPQDKKDTGDSRPDQTGNNDDKTTQPAQTGNNGTTQAEDKKKEKLTVGDNIIVTLQVIVEILRDLFSFVKNGFVHLAKSLPWVKSDEEEGNSDGEDEEDTDDDQNEQQSDQSENQSDGDTQSKETKTESAALFAYLDDQSDLNILEEGVPDGVLDTLDRLFTEM